MHKFLSVLFIVLFSFVAFAQDFSSSSNKATESFGQVPIPEQEALAITITHSVDPDSVVAGSASCNDGVVGLHTDNSYFRAFTLTNFGITLDFNISMVEIGVEQATGAGGTQPITVYLYTSSSAFPIGYPGSLTQIGTANINVPDQALTLFQIPVTGTAPAGSQLVVEIFTPDGQTAGNSFFIGSNNFGETGPSYLLAADCFVTTPFTTGQIGFPNMHIIMSVTGDEVIPVELTSFTANASAGSVELSWATATETNNLGFEVQRSDNGNEYEAISFIEGHGTTTEPQAYSYSDRNVNSGLYTYRLKQLDFDGSFEYSNVIEVEVPVLREFALDQNYPNPFNPSTKIAFRLAVDSKVSLKVFDVLGQEVANLVNANLGVGAHSIDFDASSINSGVYLYRIEATGTDGTKFVDVKKMILTK